MKLKTNKMKLLLIPSLCLSFLVSTDSKENIKELEFNYKIHQEYVNYLSLSTDFRYNDAIKSVVSIMNFDDIDLSSIGSGFIYDQDDTYQYIITNQHVVDKGVKFKVLSYTGEVQEVKLLGVDGIFDVALLKTPILKDTKVAKFPNDDFTKIENPIVGEEVYAIGNPGSLDNRGTITSGIVSGVDRNAFDDNFIKSDYAIQVDLALNPGNSGGPLFNMNQEVIGINTFKIDIVDNVTYKGLNFSLPIQDALLIVEAIRENVYFTRVTLGDNIYSSVKELSIYEKAVLGLPNDYDKGVLIKIQGYDNILNIPKYSIITKVNGYEVNSMGEFRRRIYQHGFKDNLNIKYYKYDSGFDFNELEINVKPLKYTA